MGCVGTKQKEKNKKQKDNQQQKDKQKNDQNQKSKKYYTKTHTSIQQMMDHTKQQQQKKLKQIQKSSIKKSQLLNKYRMSAQQNKCVIPKVNSYQYGPILIHNPSQMQNSYVKNKQTNSILRLNPQIGHR